MLGFYRCGTNEWIDSVTPTWRYIGSLPSLTFEMKRGLTREEGLARISARTLEGWNPWFPLPDWTQTREPAIVVPDPDDPARRRHVRVYQVPHAGSVRRFAADVTDDVCHFWLPAQPSDEGAFVASNPIYEGHWRLPDVAEDVRPWPQPDYTWAERADFLEILSRVERKAERISYRGLSICRICEKQNGHEAFRLLGWEWPAGYRHYLAEHAVRPTAEFEAFVRSKHAET